MKEVTACFRLDKSTDDQITHLIGPTYPTRSRFIRAAIDYLLAKETNKARLQVMTNAIRWG